MKTKKEEYIDKTAARLKEWSEKIDELESREGKAAVDMKTSYKDRVREIREKRDTVSQRLDDLRQSSGEAWEALKDGVENAWMDFTDALTAAREKFRKAA